MLMISFSCGAVQIDAGYGRLAEIPASPVNGTSVKVWRYKNAVYSLTKALLIEGYRDIDCTVKAKTTRRH